MNIKFCVKLGKNASDTYALFYKAYGGEAMKNSNVSERYKRFEEGRENVEHAERSGYPWSHITDENVEKVRNMAHSDRRLSIRSVTMQLNLDKEAARQILSDDLGTKKFRQNWSHDCWNKQFLAQKFIFQTEHLT